MKITFISDTHLSERDLYIPECDLLIHSGDIDARSLKNVVLFNAWLELLPAKQKIYIPGNHDFFFESHTALCKETLTNAKVLVNESFEYEGIKIWGSPITPTFFDWAFMADRGDKIKRYWDLIPENTDVLVTHGPPYKVLDYVKRGGFVGCYDLLQAVERIKPKIHSFGHIHEGYGQKTIKWNDDKETIFVNASSMNENYNLVNNPITIEL